VVAIGGDDGESIVVFKVKQPAELPHLLEIATALRTAGYEVEPPYLPGYDSPPELEFRARVAAVAA
jgi:hypothetical protein